MTFRAISLYSGAGGLDVGFERAGFEIVYANEANATAAATWMANRPKNSTAMHVGPIEEQTEALSQLEAIDAVFGGPPCQGFSIAGKMSENDARNQQIMRFLEIVGLVRPSLFLMENVDALAINSKWLPIRTQMMEKASDLGYETHVIVCNAARYGVPENRNRMLFVGSKHGLGEFATFEESLKAYESTAATVRELLSSAGRFGTPDNPNTCTAKIVPAKKPVKRKSAYSGMLVNGAGRPLNLDSVSPTLTASMGGNNTPIIDQRALEDPKCANWFESLYDRVADEGFADISVPDYIRRLTIREAAMIQTFPDDYAFEGSICAQYRQIGNAVPCLFAEAVARALKAAYLSKGDVGSRPSPMCASSSSTTVNGEAA